MIYEAHYHYAEKNHNGIRVICICIGLFLAVLFISWLSNGGQLETRYLTTEYKSETNPVMREELCEQYNTVVGTVREFDIGYRQYDVILDLGDEFTFDSVRCYLTKDQVKLLHLGDVVTIRGHLKYYQKHLIDEYEYLTIGDCIGIPPLAFRATVLDIKQAA